jgi:hypothetical protein
VLPPHEGPEPGSLGVLAVYSVHGLYRAFPPPDPPVYVWPQLKPSYGICSFTTTTFGAHRGADQGASRNTSGRDLLHLLGGSTSALPPSTAGLLQLPGLTSTRLGQHTAVPDLHRHLRASTRLPLAGIFMPRPTYLCPGRHMWGRGRLQHFPGRHMCFLAGLYVNGPAYANSAFLGQNKPGLGRFSFFPAGSGRFGPRLGQWSGVAVVRLGRLGSGPPGPKQGDARLGQHAVSSG